MIERDFSGNVTARKADYERGYERNVIMDGRDYKCVIVNERDYERG